MVSLEEAKAHLRVDTDDENALIEGYVVAATQHVENATGRALITSSWRYTTDYFPVAGETLFLGRAPLIAVQTVKYIDTAGGLITWSSSDYIVDTSGWAGGEIALAYSKFWPTTRYVRNAITVDFTAGYGSDPSLVPAPLKAAVMLVLNDIYEIRGAQLPGMTITQNETVERLLMPYRTRVVA